MKHTLLTAAVVALMSGPAAADEAAVRAAIAADDQARWHAANVFSELYNERCVEWRTEAVLAACGQPGAGPKNGVVTDQRRAVALYAELYGAALADHMLHVLGWVMGTRYGFIHGYSEALGMLLAVGVLDAESCADMIAAMR